MLIAFGSATHRSIGKTKESVRRILRQLGGRGIYFEFI